MRAKDLMQPAVQTIAADAPARQALMKFIADSSDLLLVMDGAEAVGWLDRAMIRELSAQGTRGALDELVGNLMLGDLAWCRADDTLEDILGRLAWQDASIVVVVNAQSRVEGWIARDDIPRTQAEGPEC